MGTVKDDVLAEMETQLNEGYVIESKKSDDSKKDNDKSYDVNKKFGGVYNAKVAKLISKKIKSGKYGVKK